MTSWGGVLPPPGCPMRQVVAVEVPDNPRLRAAGRFFKLECGHQQWAGLARPADAGVMVGGYRPCLSGCYVRQRAMFDQ